ncbi:helix-turn-helix domain-containing protein [Anaeromassilibacillus senegalensis]|uniref:helix-turn-helix domain-containing protein n=1 Tax=Anaeromassilibacillus senegalensis TaxID=1673717 RepID=UPI00068029C2|nr:helix-turn-helix transcriptional regulator [Anaeromassilibacillus senegalensis]
MGMAGKIEHLLRERKIKKKELAEKLGTTASNLSGKLNRDNFSEKELQEIAEACNATFEGSFILNDTGKTI